LSPVFVDTSALIALLVSSDEHHERAVRTFRSLASQDAKLVATSYVLVETYALLQRRVGLDAVRTFRENFAPLLEVIWIGSEIHELALALILERSKNRLSLVDAASFIVISQHRLRSAFAYDRHYALEGITTL
jgi:predicted nucleic acid-binding protein